MSIPKVIHYIWFGAAEKNLVIQECIRTWRSILPDYKVIEWNENNFSSENTFYNKCMSEKRYAYASDYARLEILYSEGGIYMDTDMFVSQSFNELLKFSFFAGLEREGIIGSSIIGCVPKNEYLRGLIDLYHSFDDNLSWEKYHANTVVISDYFRKFSKDTNFQDIDDVKIFNTDYFYPYPWDAPDKEFKKYISANTHAVHLWNLSWFDPLSSFLYHLHKKDNRSGWKYFGKSVRAKPFKLLKYLPYILKVSMQNMGKTKV